jgi:hypothetical protein
VPPAGQLGGGTNLHPHLFFWRNRTGHKIDLIIDESGRLCPVKIKSGLTISGDMLDSLLWWCRLTGQPPESATLVYGGDESYTRRGVAIRY